MKSNLNFHLISAKPNPNNKVLVALHGIGQTGEECYHIFSNYVADKYNVYVLDLYFHGDGALEGFIQSKDFVSKQQWQRDFAHLLEQHNINRFDIIGFSMGAKFALTAMVAFANRIDTAYLVAPDGISIHPIYSLVTKIAPCRTLFKSVMKSECFLPETLKLLNRLKLVSRSILKFTEIVLSTKEERKVVYNAWIGFRKLNVVIEAWYPQIIENGILLFLVIGEFDELIKADQVKKLSRLLPTENYVVLPTGHANIVPKMGEWIRDHSITH